MLTTVFGRGLALCRILIFALFTLLWILCYPIAYVFVGKGMQGKVRWRAVWSDIMLPILGLRFILHGREHLRRGPVIYVGNHRSYLDPIATLHFTKSVAVAKSEVAGWPVIGWATRVAGVIFVQREKKSSRGAALTAMEVVLEKGSSVLVYPEGTTTKAPELLGFRPGAFHLAASMHIPVIPVALEYADTEDAWVGDETFLPHFFRTFGKRRVVVKLSFGPEVMAEKGMDILNATHNWIAMELKTLQG